MLFVAQVVTEVARQRLAKQVFGEPGKIILLGVGSPKSNSVPW
jgi:hypothetical protein